MKLISLLGIIFMLFGFFNILFLFSGLMFLFFSFLFVASQILEKNILTREVSVKDISEGEWLAEDLKIGKKVFRYSWEGLSEKDISFIRKNKKKVKIKQGIPFGPGFMIAFVFYIFKNFFLGLFLL
jgi:5-bromo-4-chloroindolyl phosphate hydrolysis protein